MNAGTSTRFYVTPFQAVRNFPDIHTHNHNSTRAPRERYRRIRERLPTGETYRNIYYIYTDRRERECVCVYGEREGEPNDRLVFSFLGALGFRSSLLGTPQVTVRSDSAFIPFYTKQYDEPPPSRSHFQLHHAGGR